MTRTVYTAAGGDPYEESEESLKELASYEDSTDDEFGPGTCPECSTPLEARWSGVRCPACNWWFCY